MGLARIKNVRTDFLGLVLLAALVFEFPVAEASGSPCESEFQKSGYVSSQVISAACAGMTVLEGCESTSGKPIFHYEKKGREGGKNILVVGQIHGDEPLAGELALLWVERLSKISPSNTWRIVPRLNPDGAVLKTRMNQRGVDLNRNFPTKDWDSIAVSEWEAKTRRDPRRFPGTAAGSEIETKCAVAHLTGFRPDVVVSIHTPYGLLDFDGPAGRRLSFSALPWKSLGTFPGSLGRYVWTERGVPVLTIELQLNSLQKHLNEFIILQDQVSFLTVN